MAAYDEIARTSSLIDSRNDITLSFFEVFTGMAYAAFADAPVDVAVVEVGMGGSGTPTNVADAQVPVVMPIALDHTDYLGTMVDDIAVEKAGIVKHDALAVLAQQQSLAAAEVVLRRTVDVGATVAPRGHRVRLLRRDVAVGGQVLDLQGIGGNYEDVFLLHGPHQAHNAACPSLPRRHSSGAVVSGSTSTSSVRRSLRRPRPGGSKSSVAAPPCSSMPLTTRGCRRDESRNPRRDHIHPADRCDLSSRARMREECWSLEPVLAEVVVTQNSSPRSLPSDEPGYAAVDVFGSERVEVVPAMDDALDTAVTLAEEEGDLGGAGVLVTGSIVTVGDAGTLLRRSGCSSASTHRPYPAIVLRQRPRASRSAVIWFALLAAAPLSDLPMARSSSVAPHWRPPVSVTAWLLRYRWAYVVGSMLQVAPSSSLVSLCPKCSSSAGTFLILWMVAWRSVLGWTRRKPPVADDEPCIRRIRVRSQSDQTVRRLRRCRRHRRRCDARLRHSASSVRTAPARARR